MATALTVSEVILVREALRLAASRKRAQAKFIASHGKNPSRYERAHEVAAERMEDLRRRLVAGQLICV